MTDQPINNRLIVISENDLRKIMENLMAETAKRYTLTGLISEAVAAGVKRSKELNGR